MHRAVNIYNKHKMNAQTHTDSTNGSQCWLMLLVARQMTSKVERDSQTIFSLNVFHKFDKRNKIANVFFFFFSFCITLSIVMHIYAGSNKLCIICMRPMFRCNVNIALYQNFCKIIYKAKALNVHCSQLVDKNETLNWEILIEKVPNISLMNWRLKFAHQHFFPLTFLEHYTRLE